MQGEGESHQVDIFKGAPGRLLTLLGEKVSLLMAMMMHPNGGGRCLVALPRLLKIHYTACLMLCNNKGAKATKSHVGSHPAMPLKGIFQGKSYQDFKDPTLRVGAVRLHGE